MPLRHPVTLRNVDTFDNKGKIQKWEMHYLDQKKKKTATEEMTFVYSKSGATYLPESH